MKVLLEPIFGRSKPVASRARSRIIRPLERILVAVDGSEPSRRALHLAVNIAKTLGARVTIAHSVVWEPLAPSRQRRAMQQLAKEFDEKGRNILRMMSDEVAHSGVEVELVLLHGPAGEAVTKLATKGNYDLVVVGVRGRSLASRLLLGSVADRIIRICNGPVLVVH
jgi:nucleotide-binding universal stress UspA family protein